MDVERDMRSDIHAREEWESVRDETNWETGEMCDGREVIVMCERGVSPVRQ